VPGERGDRLVDADLDVLVQLGVFGQEAL